MSIVPEYARVEAGVTGVTETSPSSRSSFADLLVDVCPFALFAVDLNGAVRSWNRGAHALFGYSATEAIGRPLAALTIPEAQRAEFEAALAALRKAPRVTVHLQTHRCSKDGRRIPVSGVLQRIDGHGESVIAVTERELVTAAATASSARPLEVSADWRLDEISRLRSEFLANMSHELRTPLNTIIGFAELMHKGKVGPVSPEHVEYLGDILASSRRLLHLIDDVLDFADVHAGTMEFRAAAVNVQELIEEVVDVVRGLAASKRIDIDTHVDASVGRVVVDPIRVKQVIYNYLSNAIKFTPDGGHVAIRVSAHGPDDFRVDVEDSGMGIAPEHMDRLFIAFQPLDASTTKQHQGAGLGLALAKRIAEAHGGHVSVTSLLGQGSTFSVVLPRTAADRRPGGPDAA